MEPLNHAFTLKSLLGQSIDLQLPNSAALDYTATYITHPRDNQNEGFRFSARHSEFVQIKAQMVAKLSTGSMNGVAVVEYPDQRFQQMAIRDTGISEDGGSVRSIEQRIELTQEKGWNRESNVEIYIARGASQVMDESEDELARKLLGGKVQLIDSDVARYDGKELLLISSNIKKFLVLPK